MFKIIPNYIYFYHLEKFCILPMYPEQITEGLNSNFQSTNALSRSAPTFTYINSGPRNINISLELHRDMMNDLNKNISNLKSNVVDFTGDDYVDTLIKYLQSVALPKYNAYSQGTKTVVPPMVAIRFGDDIFIKGVVNSGINIVYKKPILSNNKYACVTVTFSVYETDPYDADTVVNDGSFRGITKMNNIYKDSSSNTGKSNENKNQNDVSKDNSTIRVKGVTESKKKEIQTSSKYKFVNTGIE